MRTVQADLDYILKHSRCPCPTKYDQAAIKEDQYRLQKFRNKRRARKRLTKNEKAEEARCMVRFDSYDKGPEATLRRRRKELETLDLRLRQERRLEIKRRG